MAQEKENTKDKDAHFNEWLLQCSKEHKIMLMRKAIEDRNIGAYFQLTKLFLDTPFQRVAFPPTKSSPNWSPTTWQGRAIKQNPWILKKSSWDTSDLIGKQIKALRDTKEKQDLGQYLTLITWLDETPTGLGAFPSATYLTMLIGNSRDSPFGGFFHFTRIATKKATPIAKPMMAAEALPCSSVAFPWSVIRHILSCLTDTLHDWLHALFNFTLTSSTWLLDCVGEAAFVVIEERLVWCLTWRGYLTPTSCRMP